ncbi:MAG: hypothetical protein JWP05_2197 [Microbacteriaceae bacterium]|nr:hypothetical protein [Microbacteriaceae bacterium]
MDKVAPTVITVSVILLLLLGMVLGWRSRKRRQVSVPRPHKVPSDIGAEILSIDLFYVSTTVAGEPLNRIAVSGLGFRARAYITVADNGIVLSIAGEPDSFIPAADLRGVRRATWTIDRVVENGGLVVLSWMLGDQLVDSYLRAPDPATTPALVAAVERLVGADTTAPATEQTVIEHVGDADREVKE